MKKALVTGAGGFVGSAVCRELIGRGVEVIAVARRQNEGLDHLARSSGIRVVLCDLSEISGLVGEVPDRDIDAFYHFAWAGTSGPARTDTKVQLANVRHTCDAVKACADLGCERFVFAASVMEFEVAALMATEAVPGASTVYSSAKLAADYMARAVAGSIGVGYVRAVISNVYGPGETSPRLVNTSLRKMLAGERCSFSAGEQLYDFLYIDDAAAAFAEVAEYGFTDKTYYIGSEAPRPLKEFLMEMRDRVDPSIEIGLGEISFKGPALTYEEFDVGALRADTGFAPKVSFVEGIDRTIEWLRNEA